jgi:hypothetical protein
MWYADWVDGSDAFIVADVSPVRPETEKERGEGRRGGQEIMVWQQRPIASADP